MKLNLILSTVLMTGCAGLPDWQDEEQDIELYAAPAAVIRAAERAVPGIELTAAQREREDGEIIYEFEGTLDGQVYEIEVNLAAEVLEVEGA